MVNHRRLWMDFQRWFIRLALLSAAGLCLAQDDHSESQDSQKETPPAVIEEVTVTAEKREDDLQRVPLALEVFDQARLEAGGTQNIKDLQNLSPSLLVSTNASYAQPYLRGVGTDLVAIGTENSIAVYYDGVYRPRSTSGIRELYDLERVELLKGPQGTLYGRNATGGAINVISSVPQAEFGAKSEVTLGNEGLWRFRGVVNAPIAEGKVFSRISLVAAESDGFVDNLFLGDDTGHQDMLAGRVQIFAAPSPRFSARFSFDFSRDQGERNLAPKVDVRDPAPAFDAGAQVPNDPFEVRYDRDPSSDLEQWGGSAHLTWDFDAVRLVSITSYFEDDLKNNLDIDATEIDIAGTRTDLAAEVITQEFQLISQHDGATDWLVGLFFLEEDADQTVDIFIPPFNPPGITDALLRPVAANEVSAYAVYGQVNHAVNPRLDLFAGLRFSHEEKDHVLDLVSLGTSLLVETNSDDWDAWTPKLGLRYNRSEDVHFFASVSRGFKSGGFNSTDTTPPVDAFDPEFLWSYEAGMKSTMLDRRVRFNTTLFVYDYSDLQVNLFDGGAIATTANAAKASIRGWEGDLLARTATGWEFALGAQLLDAEYDEYIASIPGSPSLDLSGNAMPRAPEAAFQLGIVYRLVLNGGARLAFRGDYRYQSKVYFDQFQNDLVSQGAYGVFDLGANLTSAGGRWRAGLYGRNLADKEYRHNVIRIAGLTGTLQFFEEPLEYGLKIGFHY